MVIVPYSYWLASYKSLFYGFLSDPQVIISLVAYKDTHFSVYNIKMLRKNLSTEDTEDTDGWELDGIILGSLRLEILEEIFYEMLLRKKSIIGSSDCFR